MCAICHAGHVISKQIIEWFIVELSFAKNEFISINYVFADIYLQNPKKIFYNDPIWTLKLDILSRRIFQACLILYILW